MGCRGTGSIPSNRESHRQDCSRSSRVGGFSFSPPRAPGFPIFFSSSPVSYWAPALSKAHIERSLFRLRMADYGRLMHLVFLLAGLQVPCFGCLAGAAGSRVLWTRWLLRFRPFWVIVADSSNRCDRRRGFRVFWPFSSTLLLQCPRFFFHRHPGFSLFFFRVGL